jgi:environmental stress-induced protein Ves
MAVTMLDPAGYQRFPGKNGGGVTTDIAAAYRPGAVPGDWNGMLWRFGFTPITAPGPFSSLPGIDRNQVVIGGRGLALETPDGEIDLREPFAPVRFAGETPIQTRLEDGPVVVVNLLAARTAARISLTVLQPGNRQTLTAGLHIAYACVGDSMLEGVGSIPVARDHAVRIEGGGGTMLGVSGNLVILASIMSK